jgi:hypothetical protein
MGIMSWSVLKILSFAAGLFLVGLGALDLYIGLVHSAAGEVANPELSRGFMLLFPGYVLLAYSLYQSVALTSQGVLRQRAELEAESEPQVLPDELPENVIVFPGQPLGRGPGTPGVRRYR